MQATKRRTFVWSAEDLGPLNAYVRFRFGTPELAIRHCAMLERQRRDFSNIDTGDVHILLLMWRDTVERLRQQGQLGLRRLHQAGEQDTVRLHQLDAGDVDRLAERLASLPAARQRTHRPS